MSSKHVTAFVSRPCGQVPAQEISNEALYIFIGSQNLVPSEMNAPQVRAGGVVWWSSSPPPEQKTTEVRRFESRKGVKDFIFFAPQFALLLYT
jgi:hypothetical protein